MEAFVTELFSLRGRTALVTGGSSGIGQGIARALWRAGAQVVVVARREGPLRETVAKAAADGCTAFWISADLSNRDGVRKLAETMLAEHGAPDVLVNAAGVNIRPPMTELTESDWDVTMSTNLDAPFLLGQCFGPLMVAKGWGRIINIASQQSVRAFGNSGAYGASKAGLAGLTRSQAEAWSAHGVCANAIAPGFVHTPLTEAVFSDPERAGAMARRTMIGRNGVADDFAGAAVFLASDASAYVTGQMLSVDGGFSST